MINVICVNCGYEYTVESQCKAICPVCGLKVGC